MKTIIRQVANVLGRLRRDERGAEGLEKLLIVAAIVLPLLGLLLLFRESITTWVTDNWTTVKSDSDAYNPTVP
jgi:Flp pilus assembly pilin Flp